MNRKVQTKGFSTKISNLCPNEKERFSELFGIHRFIWNTCLFYKNELYETYKRRNPCVENEQELKLLYKLGDFNNIQKELSRKKILDLPGYDFLLECPARTIQQIIRKLDSTFAKFYKGTVGYPQFKKKSELNSIQFTLASKIIKLNSNYIKITTNKMSFIVKNPIKGNTAIFSKNTKINYITISKKTNDEYYIYVNYSYELDECKQNNRITTAIGIDRGITSTAFCSDGKEFNIDKVKINKINNRLKLLQKRMSKKIKGSSNRNKLRIKIAKLHNKKVNIKTNFNHKLSHYLVKNHDLIVMEDLNIKNMTKSAKGTAKNPGHNVQAKSCLNRSILENNWGQLKQMVHHKAIFYGKNFILVKAKNTSIKCSLCGHLEKENREGKNFLCLRCNNKMDADLNAAINIKTAGLAGIACRGFSLEKPLKQELEKFKN